MTTYFEVDPMTAIIDETNAIIIETKAGDLDFDARLARIDQLTALINDLDPRTRKTAKVQQILERLSDAVLYEDITDPTPWKSHHSEYPVYSETMIKRRTSKDSQMLVAEATYDTFGKNRAKPERRLRTRHEDELINARTRSENAERRKKYQDFVSGRKKVPMLLRVAVNKEDANAKNDIDNLSPNE